MSDATWPAPKDMRLLQTRVPRPSGADKVTGRATYTYDVVDLPGLLHGRIVRCPHPHAESTGFGDTDRIRAMPGVRAVITEARPCRFAGDWTAAVAADTPERAADAARALAAQVEWKRLPFVTDPDRALRDDAPLVFGDGGRRTSNVSRPDRDEQGDPDAAWEAADARVELEVRTQVQTHVCLETHGCVAHFEGDRLTVWISTQAVHGVKSQLQRRWRDKQVRVICDHMGGGFGSKFSLDHYGLLCTMLAEQSGAPVHLMLTRPEEFLSVGNRPDSVQRIRAGATGDGTLSVFMVEGHGTGGVAGGAGWPAPYPSYDWGSHRREILQVNTNAGPACAMRAPGHPQGCFGTEVAVDQLAHELGMDPLELRLKNDSNETRREQARDGAERIGWADRRPAGEPLKEARAQGSRIARGIGVGFHAWYTGGRGGRGSSQGEVRVHPDGSVEVRVGTQDLGTGVRSIIQLITAEALGLRPEQVRPLVGDSDLPYSGGSGGSTTTPSVAPVVLDAAHRARATLLDAAAEALGCDAAELRLAEGGRVVREGAGRVMTWEELCSELGGSPVTAAGEYDADLQDRGVAGVQFAQVAVDVDTGRAQVEKVVAIQDCGLIMNRLTAESQVIGGVLQGVSYALYEERVLDHELGVVLNTTLDSYRCIGALETPEVEVVMWPMPERGAMGLGEPPVISTAAAVANAIHNATGLRLTQLPMTSDRILLAMEGA